MKKIQLKKQTVFVFAPKKNKVTPNTDPTTVTITLTI